MKRFIVLSVAFVIMFGLRNLSTQTDASLTLAAVGFIVLAAFTVGELGAKLGLPKVTGYIVAGVVLGPQATNILSTHVVTEMRVFNTLALGLIATSAGLELDLKAIRRVYKALTAVVLLKIPLLIVLVGGTFLAVETTFPSLLVPADAMLPVALVVAVLGIGTSPAIALAVVNDGRAKGRLTDLLLAIAVVKDLVVVICLAIALALSKAMLDPSAHLDAHVLIHVAEELGSSIFVGAILGGLLIGYMRFIRKQMLLMTVLMILVVAELSATLHLELLLVFIMAGFLVRNFSPYEHDLLDPIERIALPVFVVFFATAGAGVDLVGTWGLLPLALSLVFARVLAFYIAGRVGGFIGGEGPSVVQNAWLTWLPQAGVTLGLVFLAADALVDLKPQLTAIGMALVAINLLVGPITLGFGLSRAGEMGAGSAEPAGHGHGDPHALPDAPEETDAATETSSDEAEVLEVARTYEASVAEAPDDVRQLLEDLGRGLEADIARLLEDSRPPSVDHVHRTALLTRRAGTVEERLDRAATTEPAAIDWFETVDRTWTRWMARLHELPEFVSVRPLDEAPTAHQVRHGSSSRLANGTAALARLRRTSARRAPALRMMARVAFEKRLAEAMLHAIQSRHAHLARVTEHQAAALLSGAESEHGDGRLRARSSPSTPEVVHHRAQDSANRRPGEARAEAGYRPESIEDVEADPSATWIVATETVLRNTVADAMQALVDDVLEHASPLGQPVPPRYSTIEADVRSARLSMEADCRRWARAVRASFDRLRLTVVVTGLGDAVDALHQTWGASTLDDIERVVVDAVDTAIAAIDAVLVDARAGVDEDLDSRMKAVFPLKTRIAVRMAAQAFRQRVQPEKVTDLLVGAVDRIPVELTRTNATVSKLRDPRDLFSEPLPARRYFRTLLLDQRVPEVCRTLDLLVPQLESAHVLIAEGVEVASFGIAAALRDEEYAPRDTVDALQRSIEWLKDYRTLVADAIENCRSELEVERLETHDELLATLSPPSSVSRVQSNVAAMTQRLRNRAQTAGRTLARGAGHTTAWLERSFDSPQMREREMRIGATLLDGQQMREFLRPMRTTELTKAVEAMFSLRPVDDRRQFIARRPVFERLNQHIVAPDLGSPLFALVSGERSSGRTSLVNVLQLSARKLQVVRPEEAYHDRLLGVEAALAKEMRCTVDTLESTLTATRTLVILDNVERFVMPTTEGLADLALLLGLAGRTAQAGTQWVMTIERGALIRLEELMSVSSLFNQHVRLGPVPWEELETVLRGRARLGGFEVDASIDAGRLERLQWAPDDRWFQRLASATDGNLGGAIAAWRSELTVDDRRLVARTLGSRCVPFFGQLAVPARGIIAALYTWGPMTVVELVEISGLDVLVLTGHLQALGSAGLVQRSATFYLIDPALLQPIRHELVHAHLTVGGAS